MSWLGNVANRVKQTVKTTVDVVKTKVDQVRHGQTAGPELESQIESKAVQATSSLAIREVIKHFQEQVLRQGDHVRYAYTETECAIICTPTDYDPVSNFFDTTSVENTIK